MSGCGSESGQQNKEMTQRARAQEPVRVHRLSVEHYREIYNFVLKPPVLARLAKCENQSDYVSQVLELKQCLWVALNRPRLEQTVRRDRRVEVKDIFDLT